MGHELGTRIERHVVRGVNDKGFELLLEREGNNGTGSVNRRYRAVLHGGMIPFAEFETQVGTDEVLIDIKPLPYRGPDHEDHLGYYIYRPGETPTKEEKTYAHLSQWVATPEDLGRAALDAVERHAAAAGQTPPVPF